MYLKKMIISSRTGVIRNIPFHLGANLIVDETTGLNETDTGNNVGKTTVLKLIDFCLGAKPDTIFKDAETKKIFEDVKNFLVSEEVEIILEMAESLLDDQSNKIRIRRNFLARNKKLMEINGVNLIGNSGKDFENKLDCLLVGPRKIMKPSMREIFAHNIRYSEVRTNNTLKMVNEFTSDPEYETLFLFMFGLQTTDRVPYLNKLKIENEFKKRITKSHGRNELELQLSLISEKLKNLEQQKKTLNINEHYEADLSNLNIIKYKISRISSQISELSLRRELILETKKELESDISSMNVESLHEIYTQATSLIENVQKSFEELLEYHNKMVIEKIRFIVQDIPSIELELEKLDLKLNQLLSEEKKLTNDIANSDTFSDLEDIIIKMNLNYEKKGELEKTISQIIEVDENICKLNNEVEKIDEDLFSEEFNERIREQLLKFNRFFSEVSDELYGESYGITYDESFHKKSEKKIYKFSSFNKNNSSGKKQGEIICFDLAYILFAREESIPKLDFLLNDKKELMHGNQLIKVAEYAEKKEIQLFFSILKDKLPEQLSSDKNIVLTLSQDDKLFGMEK